jgi:hypothetical protein
VAERIGSADTGTRYYARGGQVYDQNGELAATARSANGRELERHDRSVQQAREQRDRRTYPHPSRVTSSGPDYVTGLLPKCPNCPLAAGHDSDCLEADGG